MIGTPVCLTGNPSFVVASAQITSVTRSRILELIGEAPPQRRQQLAANSVLPAQTSPASGSVGGQGRLSWPGVRDRMDRACGLARGLRDRRDRYPGRDLRRGPAA